MNDDKKRSKKIGYILGIVAFIALAAAATYAWLTWRSNNIVISGSSECFDVIYTKQDLGTAQNPVKIRFQESYIGADYAEVSLSLDPNCTSLIGIGSLYLTTNVGTDAAILTGGLYYTLTSVVNNEETFLKEGPITSTGDILLIDDVVVDTTTSGTTYRVYVWINGELLNNQESLTYLNASYIGEIRAEVVSTEYSSTAAEYITSLYLNHKDNTTVENNEIEYQTSSSVSLMNDRLGGTTQSLDGGNIRYYGANPNNYVWLGETYTSDLVVNNYMDDNAYETKEECLEDGGGVYCSDAAVRHSGDRKLYRIIGVFNNKLKLIAEDSIGEYSWDTSSRSVNNENNGYGINEWTQADLMKLLNPGFESLTVNNSLYWNKSEDTGTCYIGDNNATSPCNLSNVGLSTNVRSMITPATWYLGAFDEFEQYADYFYDKERDTDHVVVGTTCSTSESWCTDAIERKDVWFGNVGLYYPSDFGYAVDFNECTNDLYNYDAEECWPYNWMKPTTYWEWTLSARAGVPHVVWNVYSEGYLVEDGIATSAGGVRPVFYLKSAAVIESGTGTRSDPYVLR